MHDKPIQSSLCNRKIPTEQIDQTIDLGKLIKLTDRTIGQSYFLNGRTCTLESIQVLNFRLGIQISQQFLDPRKLQTFQGRNPDNIFVAILVQTMTPKRRFEINRPLVQNSRAQD